MLSFDQSLLNSKTYQDSKALNAACNQVFIIQTVVTVVDVLWAIATWSLKTHHVVTLVLCASGFYATKEWNPNSWMFIVIPSTILAFFSAADMLGFLFSFNYSFLRLISHAVMTGISFLQVSGVFSLWTTLMEEAVQNNTMYLNITVCNKEEFVDQKLTQKMGKMGHFLAKAANKMITDQKFTTKIADKLSAGIPEKMARQGVSIQSEVVYVKLNYFVLRLTVKNVDACKLVATKHYKEGDKNPLPDPENDLKAAKLHWYLSKVPSAVRPKLEYTMNLVMCRKLLKKLPEGVVRKMKNEADLEIKCVGKSDRKQASYFFDFVKILGEEDDEEEGGEKRTKKHGIRSLQRPNSVPNSKADKKDAVDMGGVEVNHLESVVHQSIPSSSLSDSPMISTQEGLIKPVVVNETSPSLRPFLLPRRTTSPGASPAVSGVPVLSGDDDDQVSEQDDDEGDDDGGDSSNDTHSADCKIKKKKEGLFGVRAAVKKKLKEAHQKHKDHKAAKQLEKLKGENLSPSVDKPK